MLRFGLEVDARGRRRPARAGTDSPAPILRLSNLSLGSADVEWGSGESEDWLQLRLDAVEAWSATLTADGRSGGGRRRPVRRAG